MKLPVSNVKSFYRGGMKLYGIIDKRIQTVDCEVSPYCFVHDDDVERFYRVGKCDVVKTELRFRNRGGRAWKILSNNAENIGEMRKRNSVKGIKLYEADIPFVRRLLIDYDLIVDYTVDGVAFIDVEVDDSKGFPKLGIERILSISVYDYKGVGEWFYYGDYDSEVELLVEFDKFLSKNKKDILCAWNIDFDYNYLIERAKRLGCKIEWIQNCNTIDLLSEYKFVVKGLESYSLSEVSVEEGFRRKERIKKVSDMSRSELMEYNMYDAELCFEINKRYGFVDVRIELAKLANLIFEHLSPMRLADTLILRRLRELGYVAEEYNRKGEIVGAYIKGAEAGLYQDVFVADFESLYPNTIVNEKLDISGFSGEVLPEILRKYLEKRKECKEKYNETKEEKLRFMQEALKVMMNSFYGALANDKFRFHDADLANKITGKGREMIKRVIELIENEFGYKVLYCDTDSIFVLLNCDVENKRKYAEFIVEQVNDVIKPYRLKFEYLFKKIIFPVAGVESVKKRYVGKTDSGEIVWRGLEVRRSDYPDFIKNVLYKVVEMIFDGKSRRDIDEYLTKLRDEIYAGMHNDKLIIVKSVRDINEYKVKQPHVRAYEQAIKKGWTSYDGKIKYVWVDNDVVPVLDENEVKGMKLNYRKYIEMINDVVCRVVDIFEDEKQLKLVGGDLDG